MKKHLANIITACRIVLSVVLMFTGTLSAAFYSVYIIIGITDMADGYIARRLGSESRLGAWLDSLADIVFLAVCLIKLIPVITFSAWEVVLIALIAFIRVVNIILGFAFQGRLVMLHTGLNRLTGLMLFLWPLSFGLFPAERAVVPLCAVALSASLQETFFIIKRKEQRQ